METAGLETAKLLAQGPLHYVLAVGLVFFAGAAIWLGKLAFTEIKACGERFCVLLEKTIESNNKLADAIDASARVAEARMEQRRQP